MFLFTLDRIERAVGGYFVYIAEGFSFRPRGAALLANPQNINPRWGCGSGGWRRHRRQSRYTGHESKKFRLDKGRYPAAIGKVGTGLAGY